MSRRLIISMLFALLQTFVCGSLAQSQVGDTLPDFKLCFDILSRNRDLYNQYNDSIFLIHDHDRWVNFFRRRALKNQHIYIANRETIRTIMEPFSKDTNQLTPEAYESMFLGLHKLVGQDKTDPFLVVQFCSILREYYQKRLCPDSLNHGMLVNIWLTVSYMQISKLNNNAVHTQMAYNCLMENLQEDKRSYISDYDKLRAYTLWNLIKPPFISCHYLSVSDFYKYLAELRTNIDREPLRSALLDEKVYNRMKASGVSAEESLLRNVYMVDSTVMEKQKADSLMRILVKRNLSHSEISANTHIRTLLMQVKLGELTPEQAFREAWKNYKIDFNKVKKQRLGPKELDGFMLPFFTFFYLNELTHHSFAKKRKVVRRVCKDIELVYNNRKDNQLQTNYVKYLNQLTTYPRITKYLKPAERVHFLNTLNVATQVTTYAHSVHVSFIAQELMKAILEYQPELLVGSLGDKQVSEILSKKKEYLEFIRGAGMYHDIGKNTIASVVNNDYRPLTDLEFSIIKQHPEMGLQYLELSPKLARFKDTMLGHHKWYNGKGGYPASFDNTKSPKRIMIDIVTLSDCLQAATERIGRNYKGDKTFEVVMKEFRQDAGTRYNPDLVNLIDEHPDLAKKLADLIDDGWIEIYYDIYSQYFGK